MANNVNRILHVKCMQFSATYCKKGNQEMYANHAHFLVAADAVTAPNNRNVIAARICIAHPALGLQTGRGITLAVAQVPSQNEIGT